MLRRSWRRRRRLECLRNALTSAIVYSSKSLRKLSDSGLGVLYVCMTASRPAAFGVVLPFVHPQCLRTFEPSTMPRKLEPPLLLKGRQRTCVRKACRLFVPQFPSSRSDRSDSGQVFDFDVGVRLHMPCLSYVFCQPSCAFSFSQNSIL